MPYQNPFSYNFPGMGGQSPWGGGQQSQWQWGGQQQQPQQSGNFNPSALSSWGGGQQTPAASSPYGGVDWTSFFNGMFGGGNPYGSFGPTDPYGGGGGGGGGGGSYTGTFGPYPTDPVDGAGMLGGPTPSTGTTNTASTAYTGPGTQTYDPNQSAEQNSFNNWGSGGSAPNIINSVTASFLGYGQAPAGARGYDPNLGQWVF